MIGEKRLVDVNEPINAFKRYAKNHLNATWNAFGIEEVLNAAKVVDAVEVVHGRWVHKGAWHIECSECKHILAHIGEAKNYCPNRRKENDYDET